MLCPARKELTMMWSSPHSAGAPTEQWGPWTIEISWAGARAVPSAHSRDSVS